MAAFSFRSVLEKMEHSDSDFRYMAANDLKGALKEPNLRTDSDTQKKLCKGIIKLLTDSSSEVLGLAMKCVAPLACFVEDHHALYLFERLLDAVVKPSAALPSQTTKSLRDVAFLGLKEILAALAPTDTKSVIIAKNSTPIVLHAIESTSNPAEVHIEALKLLDELLARLGREIPKFHEDARKAIFNKLDSQNSLVRKRAIGCLGSLGPICDDAVFQTTLKITLANLKTDGSYASKEKARTGMQAVWALSRSSGDRLGPFLPVVAPIVFDFCTSLTFENDDGLREQCLQVLQSFCARCRREMTPFVERLTSVAIDMSKYDPNYAYDESDDENGNNSDSVEMTDAENDVDDDDFLDFDDDNGSDDGDTSWKVRRAAIRCIHAIISGQLLSSGALYSKFGLFLVSRFKEREETAKLDVFSAFISLLRVRALAAAPDASQSMDTMPSEIVMNMEIVHAQDMAPLNDRALVIVRSLRKELEGRTESTRVKVMTVLCEYVNAAPHALAPYFGKLVNEVERALSDESVNLKTATLLFLKGVVAAGPNPMKEHVGRLVVKILATAEDRYFKITADSLRLCGKLVTAFGNASDECKNQMRPLAAQIYDAAEKRIKAVDHDSEVKEAALGCIGSTVSSFGDDLGEDRLAKVGTILCSRLKNEVTRLASVRAMLKIALSNKGDVFVPVARIVTSTVVGFLRKNAPALRAASLELLSKIPTLAPESDSKLLANVGELITDADLKLAHLALCVISSLVKARGAAICDELAKTDGVYQKSLKIAVSPLLQGRAVQSLLNLLGCLADVNGAPLSVNRMVRDLRNLVGSTDHSAIGSPSRKSPLYSIAKCVAVVCHGASQQFRSTVSEEFIQQVSGTDWKMAVFSLACLGEFGKRSLLTGGDNTKVQQAILKVLDSPVREVKTAAAVALGGLASADGETGIPVLLRLIDKRPDIRYLLLLALKDAIAFSSSAHVSKALPMLLPLLWNSVPRSNPVDMPASPSSSDDESRRIAVAECLALLAHVSPKEVVPSLQQAASSDNADIRASVMACLRFGFSASSSGVAAVELLSLELEPTLLQFVRLIDDSDVSVSHNSLQAVNAIARSRPVLMAPNINRILPLVYKRTLKNQDLVRVVDLGPFRHEEDFGLDLRKAAFVLMRTLVTGPLSPMIPMSTFLENVVVGLGDQADVRAMAQLILGAVAVSPYALQIVEMLNPVTRALTKTLSERLKDNAVRQEMDRHSDSIRGALRAVRMLEKVPEIASSPSFKTFLESVVKRQFSSKYETIIHETEMMNTASSADTSPRNASGYDAMQY